MTRTTSTFLECKVRTIQLIYAGIIIIISALTDNWLQPLIWNTIHPRSLSYGLHYGGGLLPFFTYFFLHFGLIHLSYTLVLLLIGWDGRVIDLRYASVALFVFILFHPLLTFGLAWLLAQLLHLQLMYRNLYQFSYIGGSAIAWLCIGKQRRHDAIVVIAVLFPFCYKLLYSHVFDFTPDIGHLLAYLMGFVADGFRVPALFYRSDRVRN